MQGQRWTWMSGERYDRLHGQGSDGRARTVLRADKVAGRRIVPLDPADKALIAAAPALLEALEKSLAAMEQAFALTLHLQERPINMEEVGRVHNALFLLCSETDSSARSALAKVRP